MGTAGNQRGLRNGEGALKGFTLAGTVHWRLPLDSKVVFLPSYGQHRPASERPKTRHQLPSLYLAAGRWGWGMFKGKAKCPG